MITNVNVYLYTSQSTAVCGFHGLKRVYVLHKAGIYPAQFYNGSRRKEGEWKLSLLC